MIREIALLAFRVLAISIPLLLAPAIVAGLVPLDGLAPPATAALVATAIALIGAGYIRTQSHHAQDRVHWISRDPLSFAIRRLDGGERLASAITNTFRPQLENWAAYLAAAYGCAALRVVATAASVLGLAALVFIALANHEAVLAGSRAPLIGLAVAALVAITALLMRVAMFSKASTPSPSVVAAEWGRYIADVEDSASDPKTQLRALASILIRATDGEFLRRFQRAVDAARDSDAAPPRLTRAPKPRETAAVEGR